MNVEFSYSYEVGFSGFSLSYDDVFMDDFIQIVANDFILGNVDRSLKKYTIDDVFEENERIAKNNELLVKEDDNYEERNDYLDHLYIRKLSDFYLLNYTSNGYVVVDKADFVYTLGLDSFDEDKALIYIQEYLQQVNQWMIGEIYEYTITEHCHIPKLNKHYKEIIDSCDGYFDKKYAEEAAKELVEFYEKQEEKRKKADQLQLAI